MANYPLSVFHFKVEWGGTSAAFSEVSGLDRETQVIEYRDGLSPEFHICHRIHISNHIYP